MILLGFLTIPWFGPKDTEPRATWVPKVKLGHTEPRVPLVPKVKLGHSNRMCHWSQRQFLDIQTACAMVPNIFL